MITCLRTKFEIVRYCSFSPFSMTRPLVISSIDSIFDSEHFSIQELVECCLNPHSIFSTIPDWKLMCENTQEGITSRAKRMQESVGYWSLQRNLIKRGGFESGLESEFRYSQSKIRIAHQKETILKVDYWCRIEYGLASNYKQTKRPQPHSTHHPSRRWHVSGGLVTQKAEGFILFLTSISIVHSNHFHVNSINWQPNENRRKHDALVCA